jgi:hypothetical protein
MLVVDDILMFPLRSIFFLFKEIHNAAQQEFVNEADSIRMKLSELYMMLETKRITEQEFDAGEKELLDRLDEIQTRGPASENELEADET